MSVDGLSDKVWLPRLGKIRIGEIRVSEKTGKEHPSALDFFVLPDELKLIYKEEKPRELRVMFPTENPEQFFPQYYKKYGKSKGLKCWGNGKTAVEFIEDGSGRRESKDKECPGQECEFYQKDECSPVGNLQLLVCESEDLGVYQLDTRGRRSIININSTIKLLGSTMERLTEVTFISWIPFVLSVQMEEAHPWVSGKRIKTIIPVLHGTVKIKDVQEAAKRGVKHSSQFAIHNPGRDELPQLLYPKLMNQTSEKDNNIPTDQEQKEAEEKAALEEKKEKEEKAAIEALGETEVKDESEGKVLSEKEAQKEQDKLLREGEPEGKEGRNQLNIRWHVLKKKCLEVGVFADEGSYRTWIEKEFEEGKRSSKDLDDNGMIWGIEVMAEKFNKHSEKGKE